MRSPFASDARLWRRARAILAGAALCAAPSLAQAHCFAGGRLFAATIAIEEPCVHEGMALPNFFAGSTGDSPANREQEIGGHYSKRLFENVAVEVGRHWTRLSNANQTITGPGALETGVKYQFVTLPEQEILVSAGFAVEWGNTGSFALGAPAYNVYTAGLALGRGFGDLPNALNALRPFAVTGDISYSIPGRASTTTLRTDAFGAAAFDVERHPHVLRTGMSLQYSMPYLRQHVHDFDLPYVINRLVPLVELVVDTPVANTCTSGRTPIGTVNPGLIYVETAWQLGVEAMIPVNRSSGADVGVRARLHLVLDEILPPALSRPLFTGGPPVIASLGDDR